MLRARLCGAGGAPSGFSPDAKQARAEARACLQQTPPVVGDGTVSVGSQVQHLRLPAIGAERPAVTEDDGLSAAPIFEIDLCTVCGCNGAQLGAPSK